MCAMRWSRRPFSRSWPLDMSLPPLCLREGRGAGAIVSSAVSYSMSLALCCREKPGSWHPWPRADSVALVLFSKMQTLFTRFGALHSRLLHCIGLIKHTLSEVVYAGVTLALTIPLSALSPPSPFLSHFLGLIRSTFSRVEKEEGSLS